MNESNFDWGTGTCAGAYKWVLGDYFWQPDGRFEAWLTLGASIVPAAMPSRSNVEFTETQRVQPRIKASFGNAGAAISLLFVLNEFDPNKGEIHGTVSAIIDSAKYREKHLGAEPPETITVTLSSLFTSTEATVPLPNAANFIRPAGGHADHIGGVGRTAGVPSRQLRSLVLHFPRIRNGLPTRLPDHRSRMVRLHNRRLRQQRRIQSPAIARIPVASMGLPTRALARHSAHRPVYSAYRRHPNANEIAIQAAIGLLALLPIRQVLVPSALEGITEVDIILGAEFLGFIA